MFHSKEVIMKRLVVGDYGIVEVVLSENNVPILAVPVSGNGFKSAKSFDEATEEDVLYIPASSWEDYDGTSDGLYCWTKSDFLRTVGGDPENPDPEDVRMAAELFDALEWQEPYSVFEEFMKGGRG